MKRHNPCPLLALGCALALAACAAAGAPQPSPAPGAQTPDTPEAANAPEPGFTVGELFELPYVSGGNLGYNTGDAYYEIVRQSSGTGDGLILKTDYATKTQTCLCQKPGCTHDSEDCPAYFSALGNLNLFVINDVVYLYYCGLPADKRDACGDTYDEYLAFQKEQAAANHDADYLEYLENLTPEQYETGRRKYETICSPSYLEVLTPDGQGGFDRRRIPLPDEIDWDTTLTWCDGKALYGTKGYWLDSWTSEQAGVRVSLEDGSVRYFPLLANESLVACEGSRFLTNRTVFDEPPSSAVGEDAYYAALQNARVEFDWLDAATGERELFCSLTPNLVSGGDLSDFLGLYDGKAYFQTIAVDDQGNETQRSFYYFDPSSGGFTAFAEEPPLHSLLSSFPGVGITPVQNNEGWRYYWCQYSDYATGAPTQDYLLDLATGKWHKVTQRMDYYGSSISAEVRAVTNDGQWLVAIRASLGATYDQTDYGLIDPEAFLQGSEDYALVKMYR